MWMEPTAFATTDRRRDRFMRLADVTARTALSRTTIYRRVAAGSFPAPVPISDGLVAWYEGDVDDWIERPMGWKAAA